MQKQILIVDDDPLYLDLVRDVVESHHHVALPASGATSASDLLEKSNVDVIISDIQMPGTDGFVFYESVRENPAHTSTPFIFLTGSVDRALLNRVPAEPFVRLVHKSNLVTELSRVLTQLK